jgi:histidyl-tRNA synthetase
MDKEFLQPVRGMRDFFPPDMRKRNRLFGVWAEVATEFGFEQYDAPVVESLDLLKRKAGEEITDQIYDFKDKSDRELALRPEMTPSLVRMIISKGNTLPLPAKWFSIPQCFRYERMTTGRKREHYQLNLDIFGESSQIAETEVIAVAIEILKRLGLTSKEIKVRVGSRQLLSGLLKSKDFDEKDLAVAYLGVDKRGKVSDEVITQILRDGGLSDQKIADIFEVLSYKSLSEIKSATGNVEYTKELDDLFKYAEDFGFSDYLTLDLSIVRGLAYYTGIVFECFDVEGKYRAIFGGGRYDKLFEMMGSDPLPAIGLGFGDVVIDEVLKYYSKEISSLRELDIVVAYTEIELESKAIKLANTLRDAGTTVSLLGGAQTFKKILKYSNQAEAKAVAILDPQEASAGKYILKDLLSGEQELVEI